MDADRVARGLSAVVPLAPGEAAWRRLLPQLGAQTAVDEILLVAVADADPGLEAEVTKLAALRGRVRVLRAPRGRALQQDLGARAARGRWLWFVHADTDLDPVSDVALARACGGPAALYYFDLRFAGDGPRAMRVNDVGVWLRCRLFGLPFGDQALLMPAAVYRQLGGFEAEVGRGEDHALVWMAHAARVPVRPVGAAVSTSARRYAGAGWLATTLEHLRLTWAQARRFRRRAWARWR
ncbi:MAG: glycosyltransferase [Xanthomonadales bacterium]|nr:glycosyltransferase [Xanthomonadales bacterium]